MGNAVLRIRNLTTQLGKVLRNTLSSHVWTKPFLIAAIIVLVLFSLAQAMSLVQTSKTVTNVGSVRAVGVGVYWDQACTSTVSTIDWGVLDPGGNVDRTVFTRNEGNSAVKLSLTTSNWNPGIASSYVTLTWNYEGQNVNPNQVTQVKFTLSVASNISGIADFGFDVVVTGTG